MRETKICPKCKSNDVLRVEGTYSAHGAGNYIRLGFPSFSAVLVHRYVCGKCGFTEEWIDKEDINDLKENNKGAK